MWPGTTARASPAIIRYPGWANEAGARRSGVGLMHPYNDIMKEILVSRLHFYK